MRNNLIAAIIFFFLFSFSGVLAEEQSVEVPAAVQEAIEQAAEESLASEEAKIDMEIEAKDLEVKEAKVLPGSFLYGFKNFIRGVQETIALDPVKKAEVQLRHANEKIIEAKQLVEKDGSEKSAEIAAGVLQGLNKNFERMAKQGENLKKAKVKNGEKVEKFLDKMADQSLKQQIVLQKLQEQVPEKAFVKIEEQRQQHLEKFGQVMIKVAENPQDMAQRLPQIITNQEGSDFKELKAVEILRDLEDKVPQEAKESLRQAQSALSQKFEQRFSTIQPEVRKEKLQQYAESLPGNAVRQFEAFDRIKESFQSEDMAQEMELAKDQALRKFENQFSQFQTKEAREAFMKPWSEGNPEGLRTMTEIEMRMEPPQDDPSPPLVPVWQNFQEFKQEAQNNFKERFGDNPEELQQNSVFQRMVNNPNIIDLKLSQELTQIFQPESNVGLQGAVPPPLNQPAFNFMKDFQEQTAQKFIENVSNQPIGQEAMFGPPVPGGLKVLEEIKNQAPFQGQQGINRAIEAQTQTIERHLERIEDPVMFEKYKQQIQGDQTIKQQVQKFIPNIFQKMEEQNQRIDMIEQQNQERKLQKMEEINQQIFQPQEPSQDQPKPEIMRMFKPEIRQEVEQFKEMVPEGQKPIFKPEIQPQEINSPIIKESPLNQFQPIAPLAPRIESVQSIPQKIEPAPLPPN